MNTTLALDPNAKALNKLATRVSRSLGITRDAAVWAVMWAVYNVGNSTTLLTMDDNDMWQLVSGVVADNMEAPE